MRLSLLVLLIVAVLVPAFLVFWRTKQDQARAAICHARMYNLSAAMQMYAMDWGCFPDADRWVTSLEEYCKEYDQQLRCPLDRSESRCSYGMNPAVSGRGPDSFPTGDIVVLYETARPGDNPVGGPEDVLAVARHPFGVTYVFVDGISAQRQTTQSFGTPATDEGPSGSRPDAP
jgi:hypothetical protein